MTVFSARNICPAISRLVSPSATYSRIRRSCSVSDFSSRGLLDAVADALEHPLGDRRVEQRLPGRDPADRVDQVGAADLLEHVAGGAGHDRGEQRLVVLVRGEDQALDRRGRRSGRRGTRRCRCRRAAGRRGSPRRAAAPGCGASASCAEPDSPTTSMSPSCSAAGRAGRGGRPRGRRAGRHGSSLVSTGCPRPAAQGRRSRQPRASRDAAARPGRDVRPCPAEPRLTRPWRAGHTGPGRRPIRTGRSTDDEDTAYTAAQLRAAVAARSGHRRCTTPSRGGSGCATAASRCRSTRTARLPATDPSGWGCPDRLRRRRCSTCGSPWPSPAPRPTVRLRPYPAEPDVLARLVPDLPRRPTPAEQSLYAAIPRRFSNRAPFWPDPVPADARWRLGEAARAEQCWLELVIGVSAVNAFAEIARSAHRVLERDPAYRAERTRWVRTEPAPRRHARPAPAARRPSRRTCCRRGASAAATAPPAGTSNRNRWWRCSASAGDTRRRPGARRAGVATGAAHRHRRRARRLDAVPADRGAPGPRAAAAGAGTVRHAADGDADRVRPAGWPTPPPRTSTR